MSDAEQKLRETTTYLIVIARRLMGDFPYGLEKEAYFISEDVKDTLNNIGSEDALFFAKEIEEAKLQKRFSDLKEESNGNY